METSERDESPALRDPLIGTTLGSSYRVLDRIAVGGMGVIYTVEHVGLGKHFAAKILSANLAMNEEARGRFHAEAHAASQLDHENIVTVTDFGFTDDGRPYIIMELLVGRTLDLLMAEGELALEAIVAVMLPVCSALNALHGEGIIHRDIKPENIYLVDRPGGYWSVKLLDFGIAKASSHDAKLTKMGQVIGSPMYMSPESCRGEAVDHRADIYSIGILLYQLFAGQVPFDDPSLLRVLQMQATAPVPAITAHSSQISREMEEVVLRALEKEPASRFASIAEFVGAFEAALPSGADRWFLEGMSSTRVRTVTVPTAVAPRRNPTGSTPAPIAVGDDETDRVAVPLSPTSQTILRRPKRGLLIAAAVAAAAMAVVIFLATRGASDTPATAEDSRQDSEATGAANSIVEGETIARTNSVRLTVQSRPTGALVSLDGQKLGTTPLEVDVPQTDEPTELLIHRRGFAPALRQLQLEDDTDVRVTLSSTNPATKVPAKTRPRSKRRRPRKKAPAAPPAKDSAAPSPPAKPSPKLQIRKKR